MPLFLLPFLLLALPIVEIAVFVVVGREIGVLATIGLVLASAAAGLWLLRLQGMSALARLRAGLEEGRGDPGRELVEAPMIALAGVLLIIPGFVTDAIGLLLFLPPVRGLVARLIGSRMSVRVVAGGFDTGRRGDPAREQVIEHDAAEAPRRGNAGSPWRDLRDAAD